MVDRQYRCKNERRRLEIRKRKDEDGLAIANGIDYLEVSADQNTLFVCCIHNLISTELGTENIQICEVKDSASERVNLLPIESVTAFGNLLTVRTIAPTSSSNYSLSLVKLPQFDSQLSRVEFSFRVAELSEFDCKPAPDSPDKALTPPAIDYLAKDYASFRQLMLDRLAVVMPQWKERNPADLGVTLVELVSYTADYLSYFQDAIATEAYLGTARKRISVRRHARLLNYPMHEGCNARAWVTLQVKPDQIMLLGAQLPEQGYRPGTRFLTRRTELPWVLDRKHYDAAVNAGAIVFETLHDVELHRACNELHFYTWGDRDCYLPKGTTHATLANPEETLQHYLKPGRVLMFEEVGICQEALRVDPNPEHRHAVLLTNVETAYDPLYSKSVIEIQWAIEDRLPFDLVISKIIQDQEVNDFSVAYGNVVLVDQGRTVDEEGDSGEVLYVNPQATRFRPRLKYQPLTQQGTIRNRRGERLPVTFDFQTDPADSQAIDPAVSASAAVNWNIKDVRPAIVLQEQNSEQPQPVYWYPQNDLLNSDRFAREFVVESAEDGRAYLRFGDGELGRKPSPETIFTAFYRVGNGSLGNVGADAIAHIYADRAELQDLLLEAESSSCNPHHPIRNPKPAQGGLDPEAIDQVRLYAPQAFRTSQRAVTEADYAEIAQRFPGVSKALATRRWTGSWYTVFITVDRQNGLSIDNAFKQELTTFLAQFRLTGQDIEIESPKFIPLDIALSVQVTPDYFQSQVKEALLNAFSNRILQGGQLGFFHPDHFTFGQPVYLSQVIQAAMQVTGVRSVVATRLQRLGFPSQRGLETGQISLGRLEIAVLDNDANVPGRGRIEFAMEGGL
jgi:hypothetical protein